MQLQNLQNVVNFHGQVPRAEVDAFYQKSHVFLFPSFREPSGNVVMEAMSHGLAMIVANRGGPGYVVNSNCGYVIDVDTPEQYSTKISQAIQALLDNNEKIESMGKASRAYIEKNCLWDTKINRLLEFYQDIFQNN